MVYYFFFTTEKSSSNNIQVEFSVARYYYWSSFATIHHITGSYLDWHIDLPFSSSQGNDDDCDDEDEEEKSKATCHANDEHIWWIHKKQSRVDNIVKIDLIYFSYQF